MQEWCSCGSAPGYGIQFVCDQEYPWLLVQEWNQLQLGLQAIDQEGHPGIHKALPLENTDKKNQKNMFLSKSLGPHEWRWDITLRETNIASGNWWLEDSFPIVKAHFQGLCFFFGEGDI